jgi:hypothetical protein
MADKNLLLVEGKDDAIVLSNLLLHHSVPKCCRIKDKVGIENLVATLPTELKTSDLERLGIVVDADLNIEDRWKSLRGALSRSGGVDIPSAPGPGGLVFPMALSDRDLVVGVWIMPNNKLPGMLEDFVRFLVPKERESLWNRAADCLAQIPQQERRFPAERQSKAHVHTWLSWQEEPGTPLGLAITKRYLDADAPYARQLVDWVCRLFDV